VVFAMQTDGAAFVHQFVQHNTGEIMTVKRFVSTLAVLAVLCLGFSFQTSTSASIEQQPTQAGDGPRLPVGG
jgi:hypothetical protein